MSKLRRHLSYWPVYIWSFIARNNLFYSRRSRFSRYKKALILGNGPSLQDFVASADWASIGSTHDVYCVNNFAFQDAFILCKPSQYVIFDPNYFNSLDTDLESGNSLFLKMVETVDWEMNLYIPIRFYSMGRVLIELFRNTSVRVVFFRDVGLKSYLRFPFLGLMKRQILMPRANNVLIAAIYLSILNGHNHVVIDGADHSWHQHLHVADDNLLYIKDSHFYDKDPGLSPLYKDRLTGQYFSMEEIFESYRLVHKSYRVIGELSASLGVKIFNQTPGSFIDAFPRMGRSDSV